MSIIKEDIIFGRIAVLNHFISEEQYKEAIATQQSSSKLRPLGMILLEKEYITQEQLKAILELQKKKMPRPAINREERQEDIIFAYLAVAHHYVTVQVVYECLQLQNKLVKKGLYFRLSELLINMHYISVQDVEKIIEIQNQRIIECPQCRIRYNTAGFKGSSQLSCKRCNYSFQIPTASDECESVGNFYTALENLAIQRKTDRNSSQSSNTLP